MLTFYTTSEGKEDSVPLPIPGYAFNTMAHNYLGLADILKRLGINEVNEVNAILRLSDYERKGTVQPLFLWLTKKQVYRF